MITVKDSLTFRLLVECEPLIRKMRRFRFSLLSLFGLAVLTAFSCVMWRVLVKPIIPPESLARVERGMSKEEVVALLGQPSEETNETEWKYFRKYRIGWVEVFFDVDGRVVEVNTE